MEKVGDLVRALRFLLLKRYIYNSLIEADDWASDIRTNRVDRYVVPAILSHRVKMTLGWIAEENCRADTSDRDTTLLVPHHRKTRHLYRVTLGVVRDDDPTSVAVCLVAM